MEPITWLLIIAAAVTAITTFAIAMDHGATASDAAMAAAGVTGAVVGFGGLATGKGNFSPENIRALMNSPAVENISSGLKDKFRFDAASDALSKNSGGVFMLLLGAGIIYVLARENSVSRSPLNTKLLEEN